MTLSVEFDLAAWAEAVKAPTLEPQRKALAREWKDGAARRAQEKYSGGPMSRYLTARTGRTRRSVRSRLTPDGAEVSVSGPGVFAQEYGAVITPGRGTPIRSRKTGQVLRYVPFLTFRLYQPSDTSKPTGRWVRARRVTIKAKHPLGDSAREALASLWLDLGDDA